MDFVPSLDDWFASELDDLRCRTDTKAYVVNLLSRFKPEDDLANRSVVLTYAIARENGNFATFQRIGDWVLWVDAVHPDSFQENRKIIESIGRLSYYACHRIMKGQWYVYEELADDLPRIAYAVRCKLGARRSSFGA